MSAIRLKNLSPLDFAWYRSFPLLVTWDGAIPSHDFIRSISFAIFDYYLVLQKTAGSGLQTSLLQLIDCPVLLD